MNPQKGTTMGPFGKAKITQSNKTYLKSHRKHGLREIVYPKLVFFDHWNSGFAVVVSDSENIIFLSECLTFKFWRYVQLSLPEPKLVFF